MVQTHVKHYGCIKNWKYHACVGSAQMLLVVQLNVVVRIVLHTHTNTHTLAPKRMIQPEIEILLSSPG